MFYFDLNIKQKQYLLLVIEVSCPFKQSLFFDDQSLHGDHFRTGHFEAYLVTQLPDFKYDTYLIGADSRSGNAQLPTQIKKPLSR